MKVYRFMDGEELKKILENDDNTGSVFNNKYKYLNTFHYKKSKKYLHFFKSKGSIKHIIRLYNPYHRENQEKEFFECAFNVPAWKFIPHIGFGFYYHRNKWRVATEFAVEPTSIKAENLKEVRKISVAEMKLVQREL